MEDQRVAQLLDNLNPRQREAVETISGPVLVVAGAGSGKTRVITFRIAYLLLTAAADSENILAVTFTNKAAGEMRSRVLALCGEQWKPPLISTFHAFGAQFLRRHIPLLNFPRDFLIYDEEDQLSVLKECCRELNLTDSRYDPRQMQYLLKWQKSRTGDTEVFDPNVKRVFDLYSSKLQSSRAVDFEDLLIFPLRILVSHPEVQERYRNLFRFVMVDEYQDTNEIQYDLLKALAAPQPNLLVVGDEDQSIYKFRGARSENIQHFLRDFPDAKIIKLEQNYRSTKTIIKAAQAVIHHNSSRIKKELWTENSAGEPLEVYHAFDEYDEATFVTLRVMAALKSIPASQIAVLYRANAQSRALEESFGKAQIPHRIVGAVGFYERREIRDLIAYLRLMVNRNDEFSLLRVINLPPRGVGKKMLQDIQAFSVENSIPLFEAAQKMGSRPLLQFLSYFEAAPVMQISSFFENFITEIGYIDYLRKDEQASFEERYDNVREFLGYLRESEARDDFNLAGFVSELPLQSRAEEEAEAVTLLTVHSAKGLEFRLLFVVGMEEGLFPHIRSMDRGDDLEEERRLFYVAITRAKEKVHLTWAQRRGMFGSSMSNRPSRFLEEIPDWFKLNRLSERFTTVAAPVVVQSQSKEDSGEFRVGSIVYHEKFGRGTVLQVQGTPNDWKVTIRFSTGVKTIMTRYANLTVER